MSVTKQQAQESEIMESAVRKHDPSGRRQFFVSASAFGAALAAPGAMAQTAASAPSSAPVAARKALLKDDSRLLNIGATVRAVIIGIFQLSSRLLKSSMCVTTIQLPWLNKGLCWTLEIGK